MNLEQAIEQSPDKTASNFGMRGWIKVTQKGNQFLVVTEDTPYPYKPTVYTDRERLKGVLRLYKEDAWEPYEYAFD